MQGWFRKLLKSRSRQQEQEAKVTRNSSLSSPGKTPSKQHPQLALRSELRWKRKYDLFVCHSAAHSDTEEATRLVSFLEASPQNLRCFLWHRDTCPGGAISSEFCQAVQNSHLRALLITPDFLEDEWCSYMMFQSLADGPMSSRLIPLVQNLSSSQYPQEMKYVYYIDLSKNIERAYSLVNKTVLQYLGDLVKNDRTFHCNVASSTSGLDKESSSREDELMSKYDPSGTSFPLEVMQKTDESFADVWRDHHQKWF